MLKMNFIWIVFFIAGTFVSCQKDCKTTGDCSLSPDPGSCKAAFPRYYFDREEGKCKEFIWGGCGGVVPFETVEDCSICDCN